MNSIIVSGVITGVEPDLGALFDGYLRNAGRLAAAARERWHDEDLIPFAYITRV